MATFHELTTRQLKQALQMREQIESLQEKLEALLGGKAPAAKPKQKVSRPTQKRTMSAAGRARIAEAQKARWAKTKETSSPAKATAKSAPKKKEVSDERRAKLSAAMKARWAARKKAAATGAE